MRGSVELRLNKRFHIFPQLLCQKTESSDHGTLRYLRNGERIQQKMSYLVYLIRNLLRSNWNGMRRAEQPCSLHGSSLSAALKFLSGRCKRIRTKIWSGMVAKFKTYLSMWKCSGIFFFPIFFRQKVIRNKLQTARTFPDPAGRKSDQRHYKDPRRGNSGPFHLPFHLHAWSIWIHW